MPVGRPATRSAKRCRRILVDVEEAEREADLMHATPRGLLRVTAPISLGTTILPRIIAVYLRRHAEVQVELVLQDRRLDLLADELDVAIRVGALPDSGLLGRALPPLRLGAFASPAYLEAHGRPARPADLVGHNCVDFTFAGEARLWRFDGPEGETAVPIGGTLRVDNGLAGRAAALEHVGIILQPEILVSEDVAAGRLVRVLGEYAAPALPLHLLTLPNRHPSAKLSRFVEVTIAMFKSAG